MFDIEAFFIGFILGAIVGVFPFVMTVVRQSELKRRRESVVDVTKIKPPPHR
jgi:hypothetical protein